MLNQTTFSISNAEWLPDCLLFQNLFSWVIFDSACSCPERVRTEESLFEVSGYEVTTSTSGERETNHFKYLTHNVVLATGIDHHMGGLKTTLIAKYDILLSKTINC